MKMGHKKEHPKDYEDFITDQPEPILFLTKEQEAIVADHREIIKALIGKNRTAKEIHALYWNSEKEEYTKTIKTVYRHLEVLETAGLVKVCGHRKPNESRLTEKLFCRSANIFVLEEDKAKPKWWKSEKGDRIIKKLTVLIQELFDVKLEDEAAFRTAMEQYFEQHDGIIMELWRKVPENDALSELFSQENLYEIKFFSDLVATLGVTFRNPEICEQIKELLSKKA
jgi:DNA-binding transcriptional ArsR family regulator